MDPYELFSTPPSEIMLSSTPNRPKRQPMSSTPNRAKHNTAKPTPSKSKKAPISSTPNRTKQTTVKPTPSKSTRTPIAKKGKKASKKQSNNLWDKCLKSDPQLAQFVDKFNQSLEEALSKPLDISDND